MHVTDWSTDDRGGAVQCRYLMGKQEALPHKTLKKNKIKTRIFFRTDDSSYSEWTLLHKIASFILSSYLTPSFSCLDIIEDVSLPRQT